MLLALGCSAGGGQETDGAPAFNTNAFGPGGTAMSGGPAAGSAGTSGAQPSGADGSASSSETSTSGGLGIAPSQGQAPAPVGTAGAGGSSAGPATSVATGGTGSMPPPGGDIAQGTPPVPNTSDCTGQFFCDGFEDVAAGASPNAALWKVMDSYNLVTKPTANVQVSAANAHSGGQALRVVGAQARSGAIATLPQSQYFLRVWLQVDAAPRGPVLMGLGADQNDETRLRIFNQSWATINVIPGDAVFPNGATSGNCPTCVTLMPNRWFCAEFFIDGAAQTATLWINEVEAATLTGASRQPAAPQAFLGSMGLEGGSTGVWVDDVVAGPARIGCD
jgi:hypothetical protein